MGNTRRCLVALCVPCPYGATTGLHAKGVLGVKNLTNRRFVCVTPWFPSGQEDTRLLYTDCLTNRSNSQILDLCKLVCAPLVVQIEDLQTRQAELACAPSVVQIEDLQTRVCVRGTCLVCGATLAPSQTEGYTNLRFVKAVLRARVCMHTIV